MNTTNISQKTTVYFFLSKKRHHQKIFSIKKCIQKSINDQAEVSLSSETCSSTSNRTISLNDVIIPSFFNDIPKINIKEKLKQYEKVTKDFDDIEDREIYLVRRESLLTNVSLNDSYSIYNSSSY